MASPIVRTRTRCCKQCGVEFVYPVGPGQDRAHCTPECRVAYQRSNRKPRALWPTCATEDCSSKVRAQASRHCNRCYSAIRNRRASICTVHKCGRPAVRVGHGVCEAHYGRLRSTGQTELAPRVELAVSGGYRICKDASHPLAMANGWVAEHRRVAFTKYGPDSLSCHWCSRPLDWKSAVVDHLNERKADNRPDNLVVACNPCNRIRGAMIPFIRAMSRERLAELVETFDHMRAEAPEP